MKGLVIFGGNGLLGKRICEQAVLSGYKVTSLSRSGRPPLPTSKKHDDETWISKVNWEKADVLNPSTYEKFLLDKNVNDVVHSVGILLENSNYKSILNSKGGNNNPTTKTQSYDLINRKSAVLLADTFQQCLSKKKKDENETEDSGINPSFSYISADKAFPIIPEGYILSKRKAEEELLSKYSHNLRPIIMLSLIHI